VKAGSGGVLWHASHSRKESATASRKIMADTNRRVADNGGHWATSGGNPKSGEIWRKMRLSTVRESFVASVSKMIMRRISFA
jgi:hypothetical protein